jgi:hypothetical protein
MTRNNPFRFPENEEGTFSTFVLEKSLASALNEVFEKLRQSPALVDYALLVKSGRAPPPLPDPPVVNSTVVNSTAVNPPIVNPQAQAEYDDAVRECKNAEDNLTKVKLGSAIPGRYPNAVIRLLVSGLKFTAVKEAEQKVEAARQRLDRARVALYGK